MEEKTLRIGIEKTEGKIDFLCIKWLWPVLYNKFTYAQSARHKRILSAVKKDFSEFILFQLFTRINQSNFEGSIFNTSVLPPRWVTKAIHFLSILWQKLYLNEGKACNLFSKVNKEQWLRVEERTHLNFAKLSRHKYMLFWCLILFVSNWVVVSNV